MSGRKSDDFDKKTTVKKSDSEFTLPEGKQPKETAIPTPDNPAEQLNSEHKTDASAINKANQSSLIRFFCLNPGFIKL